MAQDNTVGMLLLGMSIGSFIPRVLPPPGDVLNPFMQFLGFLFLGLAIIMFIKN